ncbi:MAG: NADPH:quinone reductase [Planctomycetaceae bacterium]
MKAAWISECGTPDVIQFGDQPRPEAGPGKVLVRTAAVAVNPIDVYIRSGSVGAKLPSPYIIGSDVAGTVEAVGEAVTRFAVGDRVWGSNQGLAGRQGTFAEYCCTDEYWLYPTPDNVTDEQAAAGALTGITAHLGLHLHANLQTGDVVFVNGGTGGVGSAVIQISKAAGATVISTAGGEEKCELARQLGADAVINYRTQNVPQAITDLRPELGAVTVWFETLRNPQPETTFPRWLSSSLHSDGWPGRRPISPSDRFTWMICEPSDLQRSTPHRWNRTRLPMASTT